MARSKNLGGARPGAGRPKVPKSQQRSVMMWCHMTPPEASKCRKRAKKAGKAKLQDWVRYKLLR